MIDLYMTDLPRNASTSVLFREAVDVVEAGFRQRYAIRVNTIRYVYWQDGDHWLGYLEEYPDYWTQGESLQDLQDHLKDLYSDLSGGHIPGARRVGELQVA